jgi:hypothetical protein
MVEMGSAVGAPGAGTAHPHPGGDAPQAARAVFARAQMQRAAVRGGPAFALTSARQLSSRLQRAPAILLRAAFRGGRFAQASAQPFSSAPAAPLPHALAPILCEDGSSVRPWDAPSRAAQLARLEGEEFDLVVVGGGCVGAGVAWEASTRGLKVALVERSDFSAGTSSRSTKLIHGGIRYLEAAIKKLDKSQYDLVVEALEERAHLLNAAPYMNHPLATLIPIYSWWEVPYTWLGTKVYDLLAGARRAVPASHFISADEALHQFPMLRPEGLKGGIVYYGEFGAPPAKPARP